MAAKAAGSLRRSRDMRVFRLLMLSAVLVLPAFLLSACGWKGDGQDVAAALQKSTQIKTREFSGNATMNLPAAAAGQGAGQATQITMKFSGKSDNSNASDPKSEFKLSFVEGTKQQLSFEMVNPGGGTAYMTTGGKAYSFPLTPDQRAQQTIDPSKVYAALATAIGDFKKSQPMQNAAGADVPTISARIDGEKLCGPVLEAFGDAITQSMQSGGFGTGTGTGAGMPGEVDGKKLFQNMCETMVKEDPKLWFGIQGGVLTDVALDATIAVPLAGNMKLSVQYHETSQGEPVEIEAPASAEPLGSLDQLGRLLAQPQF